MLESAEYVLSQGKLRVLLLATLLCFFYIGLKLVLTGEIQFLSSMWDVFLAWLSFPLAALFVYLHQNRASIWAMSVSFLVWLFVLPNSFYLVTNFYHIARVNGIYVGRDTMMSELEVQQALAINIDIIALVLAWVVGTAVGLHTVYAVHLALKKRMSSMMVSFIIGLVIASSSFAVYLGRFVRWNSWDFIVNPIGIFRDVVGIFASPMQHATAYGVTALLFLYVSSMYLGFCYWDRTKHEKRA